MKRDQRKLEADKQYIVEKRTEGTMKFKILIPFWEYRKLSYLVEDQNGNRFYVPAQESSKDSSNG